MCFGYGTQFQKAGAFGKTKSMKGNCLFNRNLSLVMAILSIIGAPPLFSQTTTLPVVTIHATDPFASESGDPGAFTLFRDGPTNNTLTVFLGIGGSASNGVDYETISNTATIPAGIRTAIIVVRPIQDLLVEGTETVELRLPSPPTANAPTYLIGGASNALVYIADDDGTNVPPTVRILTPTNHSTCSLPVTIGTCAEAHDVDDFVATVEFFVGTNSIGITTNNPSSASPVNPFCIWWSPPAAGEYVLHAVATDYRGATNSSDPITIIVLPPGLPAVTIFATDPVAAEGGTNIGIFTVSRGDFTNGEMHVYYEIGGTASNGVDYASIPDSVVIPAGAHAANIIIKPIDDSLVEGTETVALTLLPPACIAIFPPPPGCYQVGWPSNAVVFIEDNDRINNSPPRSQITTPTYDTSFYVPV